MKHAPRQYSRTDVPDWAFGVLLLLGIVVAPTAAVLVGPGRDAPATHAPRLTTRDEAGIVRTCDIVRATSEDGVVYDVANCRAGR